MAWHIRIASLNHYGVTVAWWLTLPKGKLIAELGSLAQKIGVSGRVNNHDVKTAHDVAVEACRDAREHIARGDAFKDANEHEKAAAEYLEVM
jgi:hypothetical protein